VLTRGQIVILAVFVGALYAAGAIIRDDVAPGIVGGVLAGILMYLVLGRVNERIRRRRRDSGE
jgi:VanZ family protein